MDKRVWIILSAVFFDFIGFGIVIPIFPILVTSYGGNPFIIGALFSVYSLFQFLFAPILGRLSDKYGRKPVLVVSAVLNSLGYLFIFFSQNIWVLFASRILSGIGGSNISVAQAYFADISESHERTRLMSLFSSVFGLGLIAGPFIGGFLAANFSLHAPFLLTFVFSFINAFLILTMVKESNTVLQRHIKIELFNIKVIRETLKPKNMAFLLFLFFLINFSVSLTQGVFPVFSNKMFSWGEAENGYYFATIGLITFVNQAFVIRLLLKRFSESTLIRMGLVIFGGAYMLLGMAQSVYLVVFAGALFGFGFGLLGPSVQSLISLESKPEEQGIALGVSQSFSSLARVMGPLVGGAIATYRINLPYILSAFLVFLIYLWGRKSLKFFRPK